jgi:uncharacterized protein YecE (DUF72 family)
MTNKLHIGTCSWKYDSWRGLVYSDKKDLNYLEEYARKYDTVEIDQWFWSLHGVHSVTLPRPDIVDAYLRSVPDHFTFSIKIPNSITLTHFYRRNKENDLVPNPHFLSVPLFLAFLRSVEPLKRHLGPLMFQFEYLNKQKMASQAEFQEKFQQFVSQIPDEYLYAVEIRNPNYLNTDYFSFLNQLKLSPVFLQGYYMPSIAAVYQKNASLIRDTAVIRLLGPDRKGIEKRAGGEWNRIVDAKDEELPEIRHMIQDCISRDVSIWLNVNNHFEGSAPLTIRKIKEGLAI